MPALIIHGHFYQPPRENPRTGEIEVQPTAVPYHDWNERIHAESYGPNAFARIGDGNDAIVVNNYAHISFNFGPTLLSWLDKHQPRTYKRILEADRESIARRRGHGNAIAQAYGHPILPLLNPRDQLTHVVWGLEDFRFRFKRDAESIWLPETACNEQTLGLLIDHGIRYVILAPEQAKRVRQLQRLEWIDVSGGRIDTTRPYIFFHRDGTQRSLTIFFYHGPLARSLAFERVLASSSGLVERFLNVAATGPLVNVATDGETYGHHFKFGDLCLAHALTIEAPQAGMDITNYGDYLDHHQPEIEVEIDSGPAGHGTSWSCIHGVGRWSQDCGCETGGEPGWNQKWRKPLRDALDFLRTATDRYFEELGQELFIDPWATRNAYISLILDQGRSADKFLASHGHRPLDEAEKERGLKLLDMQKNSLLMFTSCGWFFSDVGGIETIQILRYALRVIELQKELGVAPPLKEFLEILARAHSNVRGRGNGAEIFQRLLLAS